MIPSREDRLAGLREAAIARFAAAWDTATDRARIEVWKHADRVPDVRIIHTQAVTASASTRITE